MVLGVLGRCDGFGGIGLVRWLRSAVGGAARRAGLCGPLGCPCRLSRRRPRLAAHLLNLASPRSGGHANLGPHPHQGACGVGGWCRVARGLHLCRAWRVSMAEPGAPGRSLRRAAKAGGSGGNFLCMKAFLF